MGKGDWRRPAQVSDAEYEERWRKAFYEKSPTEPGGKEEREQDEQAQQPRSE
jgi:hypothetical protein